MVTKRPTDSLEILLDLATLIQTKEAAGRDKDRAALAVLRQTLEERKKR